MIVYTKPRNAPTEFIRAGDQVALVAYPDGGVVIFASVDYLNTYLERAESGEQGLNTLAWGEVTQDTAPALGYGGRGSAAYELWLKLPGMDAPTRFLRAASQLHAVRFPAEIDPWNMPAEPTSDAPADTFDPARCPNNWHASAPARMKLRCPECPPKVAPDLDWCNKADAPIEGPHIHMTSDR